MSAKVYKRAADAQQQPHSAGGDVEHLPAALAPLVAQPRWVVWRWATVRGKRTKVPHQSANPSKKARTNDPKTWSTYEAAVDAHRSGAVDGIGFCLLGSGIGAFDVDDCRDPETGAIDPWAAALVERVGSYAEVTVSGTGLRIIGLARGPRVQRKQRATDKVSVETYRDSERYIVMTGARLPGSPGRLAEIDEHVDAVVAELDAAKVNGATVPPSADAVAEEAAPDVDDLIKNGCGKHYGGDRSDAIWRVVNELRRRGHSREQIIMVLLDTRNRISEHMYEQDNPRKYAERQVEKAWKEAARETRLPDVISVVIVRGGDEDAALWTLHFGTGDALTLSSDEVHSQRTFLRRCLALGLAYNARRQERYVDWLASLIARATWEDAPPSTTAKEDFRDVLEEFLTNRQAAVHRDEILSGRPWEDEESGRYVFRLRHLRQFFKQEKSRFGEESLQRLGKRIRDLGGGSFDTTILSRTVGVFWVPSEKIKRMPPLPLRSVPDGGL